MSSLNAQYTGILPLTGDISLSEIATLSGIKDSPTFYDTVTPNVQSSTTYWFNSGASFGPGTYRVNYVSGAMKYSSNRLYSIFDYNNSNNNWNIIYNDNKDSKTAPGDRVGYSSVSACQIANSGSWVSFNHKGGKIGIYLYDKPYTDNSGAISWQLEQTEADFGAASKPYRLSEFAGQDFDIPKTGPLRFSDFRGAINYDYNYHLFVDSGIGGRGSLADTPMIYYRNSNMNIVQGGTVQYLGNISRMLDIQTKGSSINSMDTFALKTANITVSITVEATWGGAGLWMQINNETYRYISKTPGTTTATFNIATTFSGFIESVAAGLNISIAPSVVTTLLNQSAVNPFTKIVDTTGNKGALAINSAFNVVVANLNAYLEALPTATVYSVTPTDLSKVKLNTTSTPVSFTVSTYDSAIAPLCYQVATAYFNDSEHAWVSDTNTFNLSSYPIQLGTPIKFYMGGLGSNVWDYPSFTLDIINTPLIHVT